MHGRLIFKGIARGSLVQFDRGSIPGLERFIDAHPDEFADMEQMLEDLKESERVYRASTPDLTRRPIRIFYSARLWATILKSTVSGWKVKRP